jgi:hypothetical protein
MTSTPAIWLTPERETPPEWIFTRMPRARAQRT